MWDWSPSQSCFRDNLTMIGNRSKYYKYNPDVLSEEECLKVAADLKEIFEIETRSQKALEDQARLKKEQEKENIEKAEELTNRTFVNTSTFNKLLTVGKFLNAQKKIENAKEEQARQKEIGAQSGYIDTSAIYNAGVTIVDNKEIKKTLFQDYKKLGGSAINEAELIKLRDNCKKLNGWPLIVFYIAGIGWQVQLDEAKRNDITATASCF